MSCACPIEYYSRPFDYQISNIAYHKLFENRDPRNFQLTIEGVVYEFTLIPSEEADIDYIVKDIKDGKSTSNIMDSFSLDEVSETYNFERDGLNNYDTSNANISQSEKCELLRRLFLGKSIMIDYHNFQFIHQTASVIGISELNEIKDLTHKACTQQSDQFIFNFRKNVFYIKHSCKSFSFHLWTNIFSFFCFFGFFGRLLQTLWDLSGPTMVFCLFLNILILFITMALVTLKNHLVWFFIVVIPFLLYSLYFPNIVSISIVEAMERNLYLKKTFFYRHQKLITMFIKIVFKVDSIPDYIQIGKIQTFVHGVLFLTFICGFMANLVNNKAPRFLNVWLIIFVFYVPLVRYFALYIFYLIHSITSLFNRTRRRFLEIGDFDDPYLCSFYLRERSWIDFFEVKGRKKRLAHNGRLLVRLIFSKTTFSILATIAVIVYMCCAKTKMSAGQVCITVFIGILMIFVLATRITFPFFWIIRIRGHRLTEGKLDEMRDDIVRTTRRRHIRYKRRQLSLDDDQNRKESRYLPDENDDNDDNNSLTKDTASDGDGDDEAVLEGVDKEVRERVLRQEAFKWHVLATTWSKRYKYLRWTSMIIVCLMFLFVVILVPMAGVTAVDTSNGESSFVSNFTPQTNGSLSRQSWLYEMYEALLYGDRKKTSSEKLNTFNFLSGLNEFSAIDQISTETDNESLYDGYVVDNETFRYPQSPVCYMRPKGLSITEIAALTILSDPEMPGNYSEEMWWVIDQFLAERGEVGKDVVFVDTPFKWDKSFLSSMTLTRFRKPPKLSVFAIRGTSNGQDAIADVEIWFASVIINVMISFFPFVSIYSDKTVELIGVVTNLPRYAFRQFSLVEEYKNRFTDYIYAYLYGGNRTSAINNDEKEEDDKEKIDFFNSLKKSVFQWNSGRSKELLRRQLTPQKRSNIDLDFHIDPDEDIMIIGHSLGGGLAKIISLSTGIQAVALSGPGVRFIGSFYRNKTVKNVRETIVDIIPGQDLIARVDMSLGTQIHVPCHRGLSCHDTKRLICQISVMCNTFEKHREWCENYFDHAQIKEMFKLGEVVKIG